MKNLIIFASLFIINACSFTQDGVADFFNSDEMFIHSVETQNTPLREQNSVIVCRSKQCAPSKLSMSKEYIHNSLLHLLENNNKSKALICQASPNSKTCLENYITVPIKVGITPANLFIDSVKITDVMIGKGDNKIGLLLNYDVTFNGQTPDCTTANSIVYAKSTDHIILEDHGYQCKMTSLGKTVINTVFAIDYIDLDYGLIGGYFSIGLSGPAYGGGTGYMVLRLMKDAYPLSPVLMQKSTEKKSKKSQPLINDIRDVEIFPISQKQ